MIVDLEREAHTEFIEQNVEKAQKEIDRLEAEANEAPQPSNRRTHDSSRKPATKNQAVNGTASASSEPAQEKDASADVTEDLKNTSIEDSAEK